MLFDRVHDDLAVLDVLFGQNGQHINQRLAVVRQIDEAGQILLGELLIVLGHFCSHGETEMFCGVWVVVFYLK